MAKHRKAPPSRSTQPTFGRTLRKSGARTTAALAMAGAGLLVAGPIAYAGPDKGDHNSDHKGDHKGDHHKGDRHHGAHNGDHHEGDHQEGDIDVDQHESRGLVNVADNNIQAPVEVCNNYIPVNVLGIQVPIEELEVSPPITIPILSNSDTDANSGDSCDQAAAGDDQKGAGKDDQEGDKAIGVLSKTIQP